METLKDLEQESVFIIAKKYETRIDIFAGSLIEFIKYKDKLIKTKKEFLPVPFYINRKWIIFKRSSRFLL